MKKQSIALLTQSLVYPVRLMVTSVLALLVARVLGFPEAYWAPISSMIVLQSNFDASLAISCQRLAGTAIGAFLGALLVTRFGVSIISFGFGVLGVGLLSVALRLGRPANRFGGVALAVVLLIAHTEPTWIVAMHRFLEVSVGIVVALIVSALWPEEEVPMVIQEVEGCRKK